MRSCQCCGNYIKDIIYNFKLGIIDSISINPEINLKYCKKCSFYFTDSLSSQGDYDNYYINYSNKYSNSSLKKWESRKFKIQYNFLEQYIEEYNIKSILDYGGYGNIYNFFNNKEDYKLDTFDIGDKEDEKKYDLIILSHVLEHVYDIQDFMEKVKKKLTNNGLIYIEVPNADNYDKMIYDLPLQELNIEHINYFSKIALNSLMINKSFFAVTIKDDYFFEANNDKEKFHVIRGLFKSTNNKNSFEIYFNDGLLKFETIEKKLEKFKKIYLYGYGSMSNKLIYKIISKGIDVLGIIDDNPSLVNKKVKCLDKYISIINFDDYKILSKPNDNIIICILYISEKIKKKITDSINPNLNIFSISELINI